MPRQADLAQLALKHATHQGVNRTGWQYLEIVRSDRETTPEFSVVRPVLCLIVQGAKELSLAGKAFRYDPDHYLVTTVAVPLVSRVTKASPRAPYLGLVLTLDEGPIYDVLNASPSLSADTGAASPPPGGVFVEAVRPELSDAFFRLLQALGRQDELEVLAPLYTREIIYRLLTSRFAARMKQIGTAGSQTRRIGKAIERLRTGFAHPLRIAELAKASGMSLSSFHHHFRQATAMSPLQFQKQLRLHEARRLLVTGTKDAATAGYEVGYESPSQFSREYSRLFGLPPKADAKRFAEPLQT
jgi:AraC-like DNA-binding protein